MPSLVERVKKPSSTPTEKKLSFKSFQHKILPLQESGEEIYRKILLSS